LLQLVETKAWVLPKYYPIEKALVAVEVFPSAWSLSFEGHLIFLDLMNLVEAQRIHFELFQI
jgi:hypothetical protein